MPFTDLDRAGAPPGWYTARGAYAGAPEPYSYRGRIRTGHQGSGPCAHANMLHPMGSGIFGLARGTPGLPSCPFACYQSGGHVMRPTFGITTVLVLLPASLSRLAVSGGTRCYPDGL